MRLSSLMKLGMNRLFGCTWALAPTGVGAYQTLFTFNIKINKTIHKRYYSCIYDLSVPRHRI